jgi:hypothetical protein
MVIANHAEKVFQNLGLTRDPVIGSILVKSQTQTMEQLAWCC